MKKMKCGKKKNVKNVGTKIKFVHGGDPRVLGDNELSVNPKCLKEPKGLNYFYQVYLENRAWEEHTLSPPDFF